MASMESVSSDRVLFYELQLAGQWKLVVFNWKVRRKP